MGWARGTFLISRLPHAAASPASPDTIKAASVTHVEHADLPRALATPPAPKSYPRKANPETLWLASNGRDPVDEDNLPFLDPEEVARHNNVVDGIWIIIEDRVYDCTFFVEIHPGGPEVFTQFAGKQCTWQFWRWHDKLHLAEWSSALLIGKTFPVPPNPYPEPKRWIKTSKGF